MLLLGAPMSFYSTKSVVILSIGLALLGGFLYWIILGIFLSLGKNSVIPPFLATWVANIVFLAAALYIHKRIPG
jgi:lipopolysaccharide export system permease protein